MRKYQQLFTVATLPTPKGTLVLQNYYPSKPTSKKWREYVLHMAGFVGGQGLVFTTEDARDKWVAQQGVTMIQQPLAW